MNAPQILPRVFLLCQKLEKASLAEWNSKRLGQLDESRKASDEFNMIYDELNAVLMKHWQDGFDFCLMSARPEP